MQNSECIEMFEKYLVEDKKASANTLSSYLRDIRQLGDFLDAHGENGIVEASAEELSAYIEMLRANGKSVATVSRSIASIKCLYAHLFIKQLITVNPAQGLIPDKSTQKLPEILTSKEVELLLEQPKCIDPKGYRDKAMLELLYATGIRVTELIDLNIQDVNLAAGVIRCASRNRERFIPMYPAAVKALSDYITLVRPVPPGLLEDRQALSEEGRDRKGHHAPHPAPLLRRASAGKRRGHPRHPGNAGTPGHFLHAHVFPACKETAQGCLQQGSSQSIRFDCPSSRRGRRAVFFVVAKAGRVW